MHCHAHDQFISGQHKLQKHDCSKYGYKKPWWSRCCESAQKCFTCVLCALEMTQLSEAESKRRGHISVWGKVDITHLSDSFSTLWTQQNPHFWGRSFWGTCKPSYRSFWAKSCDQRQTQQRGLFIMLPLMDSSLIQWKPKLFPNQGQRDATSDMIHVCLLRPLHDTWNFHLKKQ